MHVVQTLPGGSVEVFHLEKGRFLIDGQNLRFSLNGGASGVVDLD